MNAARRPVLYANQISNYCAKIRIVLRVKGVAWDERPPPDGYGSPAYKRLIPAGTIPGFVDGDLALSESEVIGEYLEERFPEPPMLPKDPAARARARLVARWHDVRVEPPLRQMFAHMAPSRRDMAYVRDRAAEFQKRLDQLPSLVMPRPFATGAALSLADVAWPATFVMAEHMLGAVDVAWTMPAPVAAWRRALDAHPAVAPEVAAYHRAAAEWIALRSTQ